jgi:hypothetical protein
MGMERSGIAAGGTIKKELHKTPTTVFVPQLFDARLLLRGTARLILHEISSINLQLMSEPTNIAAY